MKYAIGCSRQFSIRGADIPMPIGAHVSTAGGLSTCVGRAQAMGAECMQIFLSRPAALAAAAATPTSRSPSSAAWSARRHRAELRPRDVPDQPGLGRPAAFASARSTTCRPTPAGPTGSAWPASSCTSARAAASRSTRPRSRSPRRSSRCCGRRQRAGCCSRTRPARATRSARASSRSARCSIVSDATPRLGLCLDTAHTFASGYDLRIAATASSRPSTRSTGSSGSTGCA